MTHKDITRYFMTIPEAARLVIAAGALAKGGEVFVLDMGEPVRIYDLAEWWRAGCGHVFEPKVCVRAKAKVPSCSYCSGKKVPERPIGGSRSPSSGSVPK